MGSKKITVPPAGVSKSFKMNGNTIKVAGAPSYKSSQVAPKLSFNQEGELLPLELRAQWPFYSDKPFENIVVTGTAESAGDQLYLISLNGCSEPKIGAEPSEITKSIAGQTKTKTASDSVQQFSDLELANAAGDMPKKIYIWVVGGATRGINYAFNSDPSQGYLPSDSMYYDNDQRNNSTTSERTSIVPLEIVGIDWIKSFRFIASVNGENPNLVWTADY